MEGAEESVDWGSLRATRRDSKLEEEPGISISLKPIPAAQEAVMEKAAVIPQEYAVRIVICH